ncbi:MAG: hypothetical protein K8J08_22840 [Thermoanaerobaculia bacterium]|nr:hypothetical protein [Thermoanaerobaculia bacterium]
MDAVSFEKGPLPAGCYRALFFLVILPVTLLGTWLMPVRWVSLVRSEAMVTATVRPTILWVIPIGSVRVADLRETASFPEGTWGYSDGRRVQYEDTARLILIGNQSRHEFEVSPASVGSLERRIEAFLEPDSRKSRLTLIAPVLWKVNLFFIPFSLMILAQAVGLLLWPVKVLQKWSRAGSSESTTQ